MKPDAKSGLCILEWVYGRTISQNSNNDIPALFHRITKLLAQNINGSTNLGAICNDAVTLIYEFVTPESPFWDSLKRKTNEYVKTLLPAATTYINKGRSDKTRLERAFCVAAMGNVAPMGTPSGAFTFPELVEMVNGKGSMPVLQGDLHGAVMNAENILYLTDNAGEIGFDSLVIAMLKDMGKKVTLVVKEPAYFEDATMEDALFYGLDQVADKLIAVNKVFVPGKGAGPVRRAYRDSDLLVVKGTGNYDALKGETGGKAAIFLLKIKCDPIAKDTGVNEGKFVVRLEK